jgi:hypothetical protein
MFVIRHLFPEIRDEVPEKFSKRLNFFESAFAKGFRLRARLRRDRMAFPAADAADGEKLQGTCFAFPEPPGKKLHEWSQMASPTDHTEPPKPAREKSGASCNARASWEHGCGTRDYCRNSSRR